MDATLTAAMATQVGNTIWVDRARGRQEAIKYALRAAKIDAKLRVAVDRLKQYKPKTLSEAGALIYGYSTLTEALSYHEAAVGIVEGRIELPVSDAVADRQLENIVTAAEYMEVAALDCEHIRDLLEVAGQLEGRPVPPLDSLSEVAGFLDRAAAANLNQFEQVVVAEKAKGANTSFDAMKTAMMRLDESYLVARLGMDRALPALRQLAGQKQHWPFAELGAAIHTHVLASILMAAHYSLRAKYDEDDYLVGVQGEGSLQFMLDFAQDQARRNIQLLKNHNVDPAATVFSYQVASILRGRDVVDQLDALSWLWEANVQARALAHIGGFARPEK